MRTTRSGNEGTSPRLIPWIRVTSEASKAIELSRPRSRTTASKLPKGSGPSAISQSAFRDGRPQDTIKHARRRVVGQHVVGVAVGGVYPAKAPADFVAALQRDLLERLIWRRPSGQQLPRASCRTDDRRDVNLVIDRPGGRRSIRGWFYPRAARLTPQRQGCRRSVPRHRRRHRPKSRGAQHSPAPPRACSSRLRPSRPTRSHRAA